MSYRSEQELRNSKPPLRSSVARKLSRKTLSLIIHLSRPTKRLLVVTIDICLCVLTTLLAFYLRLEEFVTVTSEALKPVLLSVVLAIPLFASTGLYRVIFRHSDWSIMAEVGRAMILYSVIYITVVTAISLDGTPRTIGLIQPFLLFFAVSGSRLLAQFWLIEIPRIRPDGGSRKRALIYGAGFAGRQLVESLSKGDDVEVLGFIDDADYLWGNFIKGFEVSAPDYLSDLIASKELTHIFLAMPSISRHRRNEIIQYLSQYRVIVRTLPSLVDIVDGNVDVSDIKELDIDDLLGREPVSPDYSLLSKNITSKTVLVTGAGGSIGSELCRQILGLRPTRILLVENSEFSLYGINADLEELKRRWEGVELVPLLASVQDEDRMRDIMKQWRPDTIYHAAAYKHVPLVEENVVEGVKNNVIGALTTVQLAIENGVSDFVLISTDKAVRPTSIMGASKRIAELCLQALFSLQIEEKINTSISEQGANSNPIKDITKLSMVRFGNVIGSSGSVIPKFRRQVVDGGPITVTHPEITRYFMTIPEAAQLVIHAGSMAQGGDVFVLDMGDPVKILDLARSIVRLSGLTVRDELNPEGDIEILITGLRPGEKLFEELLLGDDPQSTKHPRVKRAQDSFIYWEELEGSINELKGALKDNNVEKILQLVQTLVTEYKPHDEVVDLVYRKHSDSVTKAC